MTIELKSSRWQLIKYKLRNVGVRDTLLVIYLGFVQTVLLRIARLVPSARFSPRFIQMETTTQCNLKCSFCEHSFWNHKSIDLKFDDFKKMFAHFPKLKRIDLTGIGEPLMNREFFKIVEFIKSKGIYVSFSDNFTLMSEKAARRVVDLGVDRIFFSLDGATKETYEKIRVGANFDKVISNVRHLIEIKQQTGNKRPELQITCVVCQDNYHEIPEIVKLAHNMGIYWIQFSKVKIFDETKNHNTNGIRQEMDAKLEQAMELAQKLGVVAKCVNFSSNVPVEQCTMPWTGNFVTYDGYVSPCCLIHHTGDRQTQNRLSMGNLFNHSFNQIWKSDLYSGLRSKMQQGILPHTCSSCPVYTRKPDKDDSSTSGGPYH